MKNQPSAHLIPWAHGGPRLYPSHLGRANSGPHFYPLSSERFSVCAVLRWLVLRVRFFLHVGSGNSH